MKKIVTIGGGTGSYTVLSGLKNIPDITITALVSMADDGGSTGVLRDELGVLPPGDVRQCLTALSEHSDVVRNLMSYRFEEGTLKGHSFGNIFLAALEKVTGDFADGVEVISSILKVKGRVLPITKNTSELVVNLKDGSYIKGEDTINHTHFQRIGITSITYADPVVLNPQAHKALLDADIIIICPGNYYCSIVPSLIVDGFNEVLQRTKAKIIAPTNLTNKQGHTTHFTVRDYLKDIEKYLGRPIDYILINDESPSKEQINYYKMEEGDGVLVWDDMKNDVRVIRKSLLSHAIIQGNSADQGHRLRSFIRHDKDKLAEAIADILKG